MVRVAESGMVCNTCTWNPLQSTLVQPFDSKVMGYVCRLEVEVKRFDDAISTIFLRDLLRIHLKNRYFSPVWTGCFSLNEKPCF